MGTDEAKAKILLLFEGRWIGDSDLNEKMY